MKVEKTLILAKQDAIHRGLVGEIIRRFEQKGMRLAGMKLAMATKKILEEHYTKDEAMQTETGERTIKVWQENGREVKETALEIGNRIRQWNIDALQDKPVVAMVFEGFHSVEVGRKVVGHTEPRQALPGTIRGDFSAESYGLADFSKRTIINLVHASGKVSEAEREIETWFKKEEIIDYTKKDFNVIHSFD
ncbi:MAG: nucleoside-diphosphate kinase [Nanoarchaeota archaeon]|nr:nucleoside-diphosphate kinase [Nanoarchaeota archaeon]MBU1622239.1 nucleoside-diphosphate kinase [Nanoarchaeota archaeon]